MIMVGLIIMICMIDMGERSFRGEIFPLLRMKASGGCGCGIFHYTLYLMISIFGETV